MSKIVTTWKSYRDTDTHSNTHTHTHTHRHTTMAYTALSIAVAR